MSVCIYIYLYREKSYTTGLAFITYSSEVCKGQSRIIQPQMNCNYSTMAKPSVLAVYSVARRREPIAVVPWQQPLCWHQIKQAQGSAVSLLVPQVQQTRNASHLACFWSEPLFVRPKRNSRSGRSTALCSRCQWERRGEALQSSALGESGKQPAATGTGRVTIYRDGSAGPAIKGA